MQYHQASNSLLWVTLGIPLLMVILEVHSVHGGSRDSSVYGSQLNQVREQRVQPSWRWRNRNRGMNKRNNLELTTEKTPKRFYQHNDLTNNIQMDTIDSCCPTIYEMVQPIAGRNGTGHLVHLYQDGQVRQRFYEVSCHPSIVNKPCKFLERRLAKSSQCVQQHSLTYALVRPPFTHAQSDPEHPWTLDYIAIRSGCTCQVINTRRIKKRGNSRHN